MTAYNLPCFVLKNNPVTFFPPARLTRRFLWLIPASIFIILPNAAQAKFEYEFSADAMLDFTSYSGSEFVNDDQEAYLRRINLGVELEYNKQLNAEISADYSELDDEYDFKDVYIGLTPGPYLDIRFGRFKEPAGLEKNISTKNQIFLERSLATNAFSFGRKTGIGIIIDGKSWNAEVAVMRQEGVDEGYNDSNIVAMHASINPFRSEDKTEFIHFGTHYSNRDATERRYDIDEPTIAPIYGNTFHSQRYRDADIENAGIEATIAYKKFLIQAEYFEQTYNEADGDEYTHTGYYITGAYALLGGSREYRKGEVKPNKTTPQKLEIAARISQVETLNNGDGDNADVVNVILNYFPARQYRLALEYATSDIKSYDDGEVTALDGEAITARFQFIF